jgi:predicted nucleic acid-binding protein
VWPDEPINLLAAELKATHRLGIADSYIAACAMSRHAVLVTKDPDFNVLVPDLTLLQLAPHPSAHA